MDSDAYLDQLYGAFSAIAERLVEALGAFLKKVNRLFFPRDAMLARYMIWSSVCLSVYLSVGLSVTSRSFTYNNMAKSSKQRRTIAKGLSFSLAKDLREIRPGSTPYGDASRR